MAKKELPKQMSTCSKCQEFKVIVAVAYGSRLCESCYTKLQGRLKKK